MDADRWNRIEALFDEAAALAPDARAAFLDAETAGDSALREEVEALLAADADADNYLGRFNDEIVGPALESVLAEGFAAEHHQFARTADLRYFGQAFEVRVPVPEGPFEASTAAVVAERFHAEHRALYGYDFTADPGQQVEWVNLRVSGIGPIRRPEIHRSPGADGAPTVMAPPRSRPVCFDPDDGPVDTPVHWRPDLVAGSVVPGPAIIEEYGSTVPIHPGFTVRVDDFRNLVVTRSVR